MRNGETFRLEALCDAIVSTTLYSLPDSDQYRFRNPLGLRMYCDHGMFFKNCDICSVHLPSEKKEFTEGPNAGQIRVRRYDKETGMRIFGSHVDGYCAALHDLGMKCRGRSKSKVYEDSPIRELIRSYYLPDGTAEPVVRFLRRALKDDSITKHTPINFFVAREEETVNAT